MARIATWNLSRLSHNLGTGLHSGLDIRRLLDAQWQSASIRDKPYLAGVRERVSSGESLAAAFKAADGFFPPLFCEMIEVGERTGRMEVVFFRLAEYYDQLVRLRRNFLIGIAWSMFELTFGIMVVGLLIYILGMIGGENATGVFGLSGPRGAMIWFGLVACVGAVIAAPIIAMQKGWISPGPLLRLLIHVPGIGNGLRIFAMSRLTWSLAMATDSDLPPDKAIELAVRSTQNGYYLERLEPMKQTVRRGGEMHEAFRAAAIFPADFLDAVQTGELSGRVSETLTVVAKDYEERAKMWYRAMAFVCGFLVFLLVVGLAVFMIFYLFFTMYLNPIQEQLDSM